MEKKILIIASSHWLCPTPKAALPVLKGTELGSLNELSASTPSVLLVLQSKDLSGCFFSEVTLSGKLTNSPHPLAFHSLGHP